MEGTDYLSLLWEFRKTRILWDVCSNIYFLLSFSAWLHRHELRVFSPSFPWPTFVIIRTWWTLLTDPQGKQKVFEKSLLLVLHLVLFVSYKLRDHVCSSWYVIVDSVSSKNKKTKAITIPWLHFLSFSSSMLMTPKQ